MVNDLELMQIAPCGKITNLTQAVSSCHNLQLRVSTFFGCWWSNFQPIVNSLTIDDLAEELEFHLDL